MQETTWRFENPRHGLHPVTHMTSRTAGNLRLAWARASIILHREGVLAIIGVFSFVCIAVATFNKLTANRLQQEIDALESLNGSL